jgi:hypothetical protein
MLVVFFSLMAGSRQLGRQVQAAPSEWMQEQGRKSLQEFRYSLIGLDEQDQVARTNELNAVLTRIIGDRARLEEKLKEAKEGSCYTCGCGTKDNFYRCKAGGLRVAIFNGYIVTANEDGSIPLNSQILAKVDSPEGAEAIIKAVNIRPA